MIRILIENLLFQKNRKKKYLKLTKKQKTIDK